MSGNIRKQLGPVKKRLEDRIAEVNLLISDEDCTRLKSVRSKLAANIKSHEDLTAQLSAVVPVDEDEGKVIEDRLEICASLNMDAKEAMHTIDDLLAEKTEKSLTSRDEKWREAKVIQEIENLKIDAELKRAKLDAIRNETGNKNVKLPRVTLPTFDGKFTEWQAFWDSFTSTIHMNKDLSKCDKFKYLMSCLSGEAKDTLVGFKITEGQYDAAVELLKERYDDKQFIIHNHYESMTNMPRSNKSINNLRRTFNQIETHLRSLESMKEVIENNQLVSLVKSKFPPEIILRLEESRDGEWTLAKLRKMISRLIIAREKTENFDMGACSLNDNLDATDVYSGEGLFTKDTKIQCVYCNLNHWSDECQKFKTLEQRKLKAKGRCFICMSSMHYFRQCKSSRPCFYCKRKGNHHSSLCPQKFASPKDDENDYFNRGKDELGNDDMVGIEDEVSLNINQQIIMKTAKIRAVNPKSGRIENGMLMLDTGAKHSYITAELAWKLGLERGPSNLVRLNTFGNTNPREIHTNQTVFSIRQRDGSNKTIRARICKEITGKIIKSKIPLDRYKNIWKDLSMADDLPTQDRSIKLDVLIGNDYYEDIVKSDKLEIDNGLYLVNSSLGWMFSGRIPNSEDGDDDYAGCALFVGSEIDVSHAFWDLETVGVKPQDSDDFEDTKLIENFNEAIIMKEGRYQVSWPWKESKYELTTNYNLCKSRLKSLLMSFKDDKLKVKYNDIIKQQIKDDIIEEAISTEEYVMQDHIVTHYLPHHAVKKEDKLRIVYEGCAKTSPGKKSLNDCLYRGPNMVKNLAGVLIRFRMNQVAFTADIKKAYLQMQLNPEDRDVVRFLWLKDIMKPVTNDNIIEYRFVRVIWGIVCSAFLLAATIKYHLQRNEGPVSKDICQNLYVDNLISGSKTVEEAKSYYKETKELFGIASMNMCKWNSNKDELMEEINTEDRCDENPSKVLGILWDRETDEIFIQKAAEVSNENVVTKRDVLRIVSSLFDPLGLLSPVLLRSKLFLQDLWRSNFDWDASIPEEKRKMWNVILDDIKQVHNIKIQRCVDVVDTKMSTDKLEIITFTDASKQAYSAAVYVKLSGRGISNVNLIFSKSRLAPIKGNLTIPRLELMGVLIGCRASKYVAEQLGNTNIKQKLFTDSKCVLEWCKTDKDLKRFVNERIKEIRHHNVEIGYVKSSENPADIATRGSNVGKLRLDDLWWKGPAWLKLENNDWPTFMYAMNKEDSEVVDGEVRGKVVYETGLIEEIAQTPTGVLGIREERFSSYWRLIRVTAWSMRFIHNLMKKVKKKGVLNADELRGANEMWVKCIQRRCFQDIFDALENGKKQAIIAQLGLYRDSIGVIRCAGRFNNQQRHVMLLPKQDHFSKLLIIRDHRKLLHAGVSQTLSEVRKEYWIIHGRSEVRRIIRQCLICIHWEGGPFKTPPFAPFPDYVISSDNPPFTFIGLDYLGPLVINDDDVITKNWICLFTCLNVRAVHLEVVKDMTSKSFLLCVRRFFARRGRPSLIISDNGSQIKLGNAVIERVWNAVVEDKDLQSYIATNGISWKYVTEYSPWKGGFYERLVGMTKRALKKTLQRSRVDDQQLVTIVTEVEAVLNCRPLVYVNDDVNSIEILTPSHFLSINHKTGTPVIEEEYFPKETSATVLVDTWKKGQKQLNQFWKIWHNEYLEGIRENSKHQMKAIRGETERLPKIGEVVHIKENDLPRGRWKVARIDGLIESNIDGVPRAAKLMTPTGKVFKRPFRLIYPLECPEHYST